MVKKFFSSLRSGNIDRSQAIAVIGLGRFGLSLAEELVNQGYEVLGIDVDEQIVQDASGQLTHVVRADTTKPEVLEGLGLGDMAKVVVAIGNRLEASILTASALLRMEDGPEVWAKASTEGQAVILQQMGITHVFRPESDMGKRAAHVVARSMNDYVDLGYGFAMISTPTPENLENHSLADCGMRRKWGITVIAVRSETEWKAANPDTVLRPGDTILVVGPKDKMEQLYK